MVEPSKPPSERTLERDIPELKAYLWPGAHVLDIGCGTGTITLDVAAAICPGKVIGVDSDDGQVKVAREWLAQQPGIGNVSFQVADSHALDFPDSKFDLVYSHTVVHFFLDPVAALKEQKRVTKPGGWVVASGVRGINSGRYPPCPNWERVGEARRLYREQTLRDFQASGQSPAAYLRQQRASNPTYMSYMAAHAGRKCAGWLLDAGLIDLQIRIKAERVQYHGSEIMEPSVWDGVSVEKPETVWEKQRAKDIETVIALGLLDAETVQRARQENEAWYKDIHAFYFNTLVFVAGRVP